MTRVFISYRRTDSQHITDHIIGHLLGASFSIFRDITSIMPGDDFRQKIESALTEAEVLVAIIGKRWLGRKRKSAQPQIWRDDDYVRYEVRAALERGVPLIPVLIDAAVFPSRNDLPEDIHDLLYKQATCIRSGLDFDTDMERLIRSIRLHAPRKGRGTAIKLGYLLGKLEIFLRLTETGEHRYAAEPVIQKITWLANHLGLAFDVKRLQDGLSGNMQLLTAHLRDNVRAAFEIGYSVGRFYGMALVFVATGLVKDDNITDTLGNTTSLLLKAELPKDFLAPVAVHWFSISERIKASNFLNPKETRHAEAEVDQIIDRLGSQVSES